MLNFNGTRMTQIKLIFTDKNKINYKRSIILKLCL